MTKREKPALRIAPPAFLNDGALRRVLAALPGARLVGGCVRDALAGRPVADIDLATPLLPQEVMRALKSARLKSVPTGLDHGTVTAVAWGRGFEVTTLRRDVETDGRHAVVAYTDDWRADASRRDFTINAMSMARHGAVFDYFGGVADLAAGRVRFVGDPATRIAEDYLRILRFFRFFARYGNGEPDQAAMDAIAGAVDGLSRLSAERVWAELKRILVADDPDRTVALMHQLGVWQAIMPPKSSEATEDEALANPDIDPLPLVEGGNITMDQRSVRFTGLEAGEIQLSALPQDPVLRLAAFRPGDVGERFRMSAVERKRLIALHGPPPPEHADDDTLRRLLTETAPDILVGRAWLAGRPAELRARIAAMEVPRFPLYGRDLRAAGILPGPGMGAVLRELRDWWMEGGCRADAAELWSELARRRAG